MIVDLDAHQGNGHARDFMDEDGVYILDIYNRQIYPRDGFAKSEKSNFFSFQVFLFLSQEGSGEKWSWRPSRRTRNIYAKSESEFILRFRSYFLLGMLFCSNVEGALNEFEPDLVVYNAGTDVLEGDPLGLLSITPQVKGLYAYCETVKALCIPRWLKGLFRIKTNFLIFYY